MATSKSDVSQYRRAGEFDQFGKSIDAILDKDMLLRRFSVGERDIRDRDTESETFGQKKTNPFVTVYVNDLDDLDAPPIAYHAWSGDLAGKLAQIPDDELPVIIKFVRVPTGGGFKVYSFE